MEQSFTSLSGSSSDDGPSPAEVVQVEELLRALSTTLRSYRLYAGNSPMLEKFVETLQQKLTAVWEEIPLLRLDIEEQKIRWEGQEVYPKGDANADLAFLFYKDGVRELTILPGFEEKEVHSLLRVLARAPQLREDEDDLITLLWEEDFTKLRYQYVEAVTEGAEISTGPPTVTSPLDPAAVRTAAAEPDAGLSTDDFQETLYFLDDAELRQLTAEVQKEADRDLWEGVTTALFDRLEDGSPERQIRIVELFAELLPSMLGAGEIRRVSNMLGELIELARRPGVFAAQTLREVRGLFTQLADPKTVQELVHILEDTPDALRDDALIRLLGFFPPEALGPLMRVTETVSRPDVRRLLEQAVQRLAEGNKDRVIDLLEDDDPTLVAGAARWVGRLGLGATVQTLVRLLGSSEEAVRLASIQALQDLRASTVGKALEERLEDESREVRVAAAKALGALDISSARGALESALGSKRLRAADRTEKVAFFESYGRLAGADGVALLDRTLNGKSWLGRGETTEIRACAALALAKVRHPSAKEALNSAANDPDPVIRTTVARALKEESQ